MKVLVAIANYGPFRFGYLDRVIRAYRDMPFQTTIVLNSDRPKRVPDGVELIVGLPTPDPHSLPFAHKTLFAERARDFDLFVYSEDDILIEAHQLIAFLKATEVLPEDETPGFFRYEYGPDGQIWYVDAHLPYDWVPGSVRRHGDYVFASFSNEHSGCYVLTQVQLERAIHSGGYLVPPHRDLYEMRESAATDPYTRCGLAKRLCLSHWREFLIHHLPNTYAGALGARQNQFDAQVEQRLAEAQKV
jgi:hypothetical protein